ncbi:hypothetical protein BGX26_004164 [Mortierella sp. AD094]|nr:hypothetical protein BGX26_004164 [Mortierella sp. AD094]
MTSFVKDKACMTLAAIVLDTGKRVFKHPDRSQTKRERSEGYIEWSQKTLNLTKNFQVFVGEQVQRDKELKEHAADMTIGAQLRSLATVLFKDICSSGSDAAACRSLVRYALFYTRSRFISSEAIKNNHPDIQSEIAKFVNAVEEIIVSALFGSERASDDEKRALIHEFALASGPRAAIDLGEPLSDYEWDMGRLKFLLKVISIFDEFSPTLRLQLYPTRGTTAPDSILSKIVDCANVIGLREFVPLTVEGAGQENGDLYVRILSDLCTFALLLRPKQFAKMQIDMIGLVLARSELWSLIAEDWWTCISDRLGQDFTLVQVQVLMELLLSLPIGRASQKVGSLIACMVPLLNEHSQLILARSLMASLEHKSHQNIQTLLVGFPYECLSGSNLDLLVNRCTDGWREACDLLRDERLVLEAFYTMHQYVACLATIFSKSECRLAISDDMRVSLVGWSVEIIGGAHELLMLVQDDEKALSKISFTIEGLVAFLQSVQPIPCPKLIHVLDTIVSWESLPYEKRPLSRLSIAGFLSSCSSVEIPEESYMRGSADVLGLDGREDEVAAIPAIQ